MITMSEEKLFPKLRFSEYTDNFKSSRLEDVCEVKGRIGFRGYTKSDLVGKNEGALTLGGKHIDSNDKLNLDDPDYLSWEKYEESPEIKVKVGNIILAQRGTLGQSALIDKDIGKATINPSMVLLKDFKINNIFLHYLLTTSKLKKEVIRKSSSTAVPMISQAEIKKLKINYPSSSEQEKIGHFFKITDNKIELLKNKLKSYQNFKKYLMQQIFAQKLRFAEYNEKYDEYLISDLFTSKKGSGLSKDTIENDGTNKCVLYGELYTTYNEIIDNVKSRTNSECNCLSKSGDILIPASTTTKGIDLVTASVILEDNVYLGGDITILRNKDESIVNNSYFAYYFTNGLIKEVSRLTQGSTIIHLYWKDFKKVNVKLPSIEEQEKITNMFVDIDKKLNDINNSIESIQKFKKGLLQQMFV